MTPHPPLKHILWICRWYSNREDPQLGVFIQKQAEALADHYRVCVVYAMAVDQGETGSVIRENGNLLEIIQYYPRRHGWLSRWIAYALSIQSAVALALQHFGKPSLVVGYILNRSGIMARRLARTHGIPFVVAEQWSGYASGAFAKRGWVHRHLSKRLCAEAAGVMVVSGFLQTAMERQGLKGRYSVVPNIVASPPVSSRPGKSADTIEILLVADLVDRIKNISDVIRSMKELHRLHPRIRLTIIGDGPDRGELEKLAAAQSLPEAHIRFLGRLPNNEVYQHLSQSDFLVMNSRVETFSLICAEAMSCGKPVVATRCGGPESFITDSDGILIAPDAPDELLAALEQMCRTFQTFQPETIREHAIARFSRKAVGAQLASLTEGWIRGS